ncbi:histidine acid phosphatase [Colletotrichum graminicola]|uniref:Histidine acid phosphatase n=1 Tax=Colletotrichum graminicola (strain M1.001 / M2 / FGSC 10212) TaxID=645133 RepID=E3QD06_COLGM|nr:histidine acid phosphatase [Colletotrichum graminicola M1.001]EFQ28778.1 histidine acid phosphatase [Colletotrichum graminicola M1.001]WDK18909.1 histidine acid phosphatase [Colletotrichum graminicola]
MELKLLLALGLPIIPTAAETVLGVYVFHRHGDRTAKKTPPVRFTDLGAYEVYTSGLYYGERYVRDNATAQIRSISADDVRPEQLAVTSPSDVVLQSSAYAFLQGFYPPSGTADALANGSRVEAPLGGYQYVPVNSAATGAATTSANAESSEWLQGGSGCGKAVVSSNNYFSSPEYAALEAESRVFYRGLLPVINGTFDDEAASFANAYTIFDLVNVAIIHNESIPAADLLTGAAVRTLTDYANIHEWNLAFNESDPIRAIAGKVLAGQVLRGLNATLSGSAVKANIQFGAYGAFSSFFGLAQMHRVSEDFKAIVDYASSMVFELVTNDTSASPAADDISVRFRFANGSAGASPLTAYPLFGRAETVLPWATFVDEMRQFAVEDTKSWCTACGNSTGTCAAALGLDGSADSNSWRSGSGGGGISAPVAGVIGALVTLVVIMGIQGLFMLVGGLRMVKKPNVAKDVPAASTTEEVASRKH